MTGRKKRLRDEDQEGPIAKKINRLHIRHSPVLPQCPNPDGSSCEVDMSTNSYSNGSYQKLISPRTDNPEHCHANHSNESNSNSSSIATPSTSTSAPHCYCPELTREENPHYYSINEQLYYFHQERLSRHQN